MNKLIITVLGKDRPGIIAQVTSDLFDLECNLENVNQMILQNQFAGFFIVEAPGGLSPETIEDDLTKRKVVYEQALNHRLPFVKFVKAFLHSPVIAKELMGEPVPSAKPKGFRRDEISNPLRFLEDHATEHKPAMIKSIWILQHLAFCKHDG